MACFFSRKLNGISGGGPKNENAAGCALPTYLWNCEENIYHLICSGDFRECPVKDRYVSLSLVNYWSSEERKNHRLFMDQAKAENGRKL